MAQGEASIVINRAPADVLDFVMDLRQYRQVDEKRGTIHSIKDAQEGNGVLVNLSPKVLGLPGPKTTQRVARGNDRIDISGVPAWTGAPMTFTAFFQLEPVADGTKVTRNLNFRSIKAVAWALDPVFERWLAKAVPQELATAKEYLEAGRDRQQ